MLRLHPYHVSHFGISERPSKAPCPLCEGPSLWCYGSALTCYRCGWHSAQLRAGNPKIRPMVRRWMRFLKDLIGRGSSTPVPLAMPEPTLDHAAKGFAKEMGG